MIPLPKTTSVIERGISEGLHLGCQLYISVAGSVQADLGFGEARLAAPLTRESILLWLSSAKPLTAVAIGQLWERGQLNLEDPVAKIIPEFGQKGKGTVTTRHLLTHTGSIRTTDKCDLGEAWSEILACISEAELEPNSAPGRRAAYHPSGSWYLLGELVRRIDGRPIEQYVRDEIGGPCGMTDTWLALPADQFRRYGERIAFMYHTDRQPPTPHRRWNTATEAAICRPGRNGRGPARALGRFYETLLALRDGREAAPILKTETVRQMTQRQRRGMFDDTFQQVIDWGLGFALDSKTPVRELVSYGFGRFASHETFGHGGSQSSCAYADPVHQLAVAWACNGLPGERRHQQRAHALNSAIYEDLGLDRAPAG